VCVRVQVGKHPNADSLYLEEIDVGEAQPRQVWVWVWVRVCVGVGGWVGVGVGVDEEHS